MLRNPLCHIRCIRIMAFPVLVFLSLLLHQQQLVKLLLQLVHRLVRFFELLLLLVLFFTIVKLVPMTCISVDVRLYQEVFVSA